MANIYVGGNGAVTSQAIAGATQTAQVVSPDIINYGEGLSYSPSTMTGFIGIENEEKPASKPVNYGLWLQDIAQSHHFTVQISGFKSSGYKVPNAPYSQFLPVKTMQLNYTSYENMTIPLQIFGDFPILNRKRVSTISLTCYDNDDNQLEHELRMWEAQCFPKNQFVAFMSDIARKLEYRGYNVKGVETFKASMWVIPSNVVSISRDYSANDAKLLNFTLVAVGDGVNCATNSSVGKSQDAQDDKKAEESWSLKSTWKDNPVTGVNRLAD